MPVGAAFGWAASAWPHQSHGSAVLSWGFPGCLAPGWGAGTGSGCRVLPHQTPTGISHRSRHPQTLGSPWQHDTGHCSVLVEEQMTKSTTQGQMELRNWNKISVHTCIRKILTREQ